MKIGIVGYGNLGKALLECAGASEGVEVIGVFSRRSVNLGEVPVFSQEELRDFDGKIDCLLLALGSSSDLPRDTARFARGFNVVDSFDNHAKIKEHYLRVDAAAKEGGHTAIISSGWDPGLLSLIRLFGKSFLEEAARISSFWGRGVSQGHSEAIRKIPGVKMAVQYTVPREEAINEALLGKAPVGAKASHIRECYVVAEAGREAEIEEKIKSIPEYFLGYETKVFFVGEEEFLKNHLTSYHGGRVVSFGRTGKSASAAMDFKLKMDSNPAFTAGIMLAYARAAKRLYELRDFGAKTVFDVPPSMLFDGELFKLL